MHKLVEVSAAEILLGRDISQDRIGGAEKVVGDRCTRVSLPWAHRYAESHAAIVQNTSAAASLFIWSERRRRSTRFPGKRHGISMPSTEKPVLVDRIRNGPGGEDLDRFADALGEDGYRRHHAYGLLEAPRHLALWAHREGTPLTELTAEDRSKRPS